VRLFVGVELEAAARAAAAAAADALRSRLARLAPIEARWIAPDNLHITIWFLGEVSADRGPEVESALLPPVPVPPFTMELDGFGVFPPSGAPRVFWIGVGRGQAQLAALYSVVGGRLVPLGFEAETRPYSAHLTLARVRDARGRGSATRAVRPLLARTTVPPIPSRVAHLSLFRSYLSPKGARYEPVLRVPLTG
jgi:2'-5' RNA ligase